MEKDLKKGIVLLKALIFHYHGLDEDEKLLLEEFVKRIDAEPELQWAYSFISSDYLSAFERSREFLLKIFSDLPESKRLEYLLDTWEDNHKKGYVTEMETTAMLNLAKDWAVEKKFLTTINQI